MKYFDYAATCPMDKDAAKVYLEAATGYYGNANSLHDIGGKAKLLLENARKSLADLLGVDEQGLFFTSGGSESNFLAIEALLSARKKDGFHIITSSAEHSSIHGSLQRLAGMGCEITCLPFSEGGLISTEQVRNAIRKDTVLIAIQHVNSEIGTIQPIEEIWDLCEKNNILFHSDYVQSFGKICNKKLNSRISSFSFSGHKLYGPKGIGGVYINPRLHWKPFFPGGTHEKGLRPGTVNVPGIAAMAAAAQKAFNTSQENSKKYWLYREIFMEAVKPISQLMTVQEAAPENQYPGILGLRVSGLEGQWLMLELNRNGYAISTGSACQTGLMSPSKTMVALGIEGKQAKEFIRISFGQYTEKEDVQKLGECLVNIVQSVNNEPVIY